MLEQKIIKYGFGFSKIVVIDTIVIVSLLPASVGFLKFCYVVGWTILQLNETKNGNSIAIILIFIRVAISVQVYIVEVQKSVW